MATTKPRKSEMWQRFRTARQYAKKTQASVAYAIGGITRGAVAQWEANTEVLRTRPTADQVMAFAQACGIPVSWLLDDTESCEGLYSYMQTHKAAADATARPNASAREEVQGKAFWSAVHYGAILANPKLVDRFNVKIERLIDADVRAQFLDGNHLASFTADSADWRAVLVREVAGLLLIEKALGFPCKKAVFIWSPVEATTTKEMALFAKHLDTTAILCHDVQAAAKRVAAL